MVCLRVCKRKQIFGTFENSRKVQERRKFAVNYIHDTMVTENTFSARYGAYDTQAHPAHTPITEEDNEDDSTQNVYTIV